MSWVTFSSAKVILCLSPSRLVGIFWCPFQQNIDIITVTLVRYNPPKTVNGINNIQGERVKDSQSIARRWLSGQKYKYKVQTTYQQYEWEGSFGICKEVQRCATKFQGEYFMIWFEQDNSPAKYWQHQNVEKVRICLWPKIYKLICKEWWRQYLHLG